MDAPRDLTQIHKAEAAAREAIDLGRALEDTPWLGRRPTLPDSCPAIGLAPGARHLSVAFGHQHMGFVSGAGTAVVLADLIEGKATQIDAHPFRPERYLRRLT